MRPHSSHLSGVQFWTLNVLAGLAFLLVILNYSLLTDNRTRQAEVRAQQQYINETVRLSRLNSQIIQALAELSVKTGDQQIGRLLASQGITFSVAPATDSSVADETAAGQLPAAQDSLEQDPIN